MIWDSHGQEQQANAETRFMIQAKGFWGGCVGRMRLVDGCRMCWGKIHIFRFSEVFFGVEGKDAKRFFFGTYKNHFANASIGTFGSLVYRSFFLNISHPFFWWFWKFDLNYSTRKWSPGTSIYQSSKVFWCSRFLDLLNKAILFFFCILTFWTMIWIATFWPYFSRGKKMVKHQFFFGKFLVELCQPSQAGDPHSLKLT